MSLLPLILTSALLFSVVLISAVVSALETALFCLKEHHMAVIGDSRPEISGIMKAIARRPRRSQHQVLFLGSVLNLSLAVLGLFLLREFGPIIPGRPYLSATVLFGALVIASELIPTLVALAAPVRVFQLTVAPLIRLSPFLERLSGGLEIISTRLGEKLAPAHLKPRKALTDEEIETLVELRRDQGVLAPSESEIIQEILRLGNMTASDCMTPRVDAFMLSDRLDNATVMERLRESAEWHWFVPVFQGSPDLVIGALDVKRWLFEPGADYRTFIDPPVFIPETMNALEAFRDYLGSPRSLAVILDEYGGVDGVLTHGDMIEEILAGAAPGLDREDGIEILGPGRIRADGAARLDEIAEALDINLDYESINTIGGLVFNEVGQVPPPGAQLVIGEMRITVRRSQRQRITAVEISLAGNADAISADNARG